MELYVDIATPEELEGHFGYSPSPDDISRERKYCLEDPDRNYQELYWLYFARGDKKTAQSYLDKIKDPLCRLDTTMLVSECIDDSPLVKE